MPPRVFSGEGIADLADFGCGSSICLLQVRKLPSKLLPLLFRCFVSAVERLALVRCRSCLACASACSVFS